MQYLCAVGSAVEPGSSSMYGVYQNRQRTEKAASQSNEEIGMSITGVVAILTIDARNIITESLTLSFKLVNPKL